MSIEDLVVYGDSILITFWQEWEVQNLELLKYRRCLAQLSECYGYVSFNYIPCLKNQFTDPLATLASMLKISEEVDYAKLSFKLKTSHHIAKMFKKSPMAVCGSMTPRCF